MSKSVLAAAGESKNEKPLVLNRQAGRLIRWTSRLGVWGIVGGFAPIIAFTLGAPITLEASISLLAGGLVVGGVGTTAASVLVYRNAPTGSRLLRAVAGLGGPLGVALAAVGITTLLGWEIVSAVGGIGLSIAGVVLVVLLVATFLWNWPQEREEADSKSQF